MSNLLGQVSEIRQQDAELLRQHEADDKKKFFEIVLRDHFGKTEGGDAQELLNVMQMLELTETDYANALQAIDQVCEAAAEQQRLDAAMKGQPKRYREARIKMLTANVDVKRFQREVHDESKLPSELNAAKQVVKDMAESHPMLFDESGQPLALLDPAIKQSKSERQAAAKQYSEQVKAAFDSDLQRKLVTQGLAEPE
ncbi:hypothetical protein RBSH_02344 [Rhodopirellula baltica SH28]|uniref:Uncharacterized protein n=1 Tax=Rhodopirellula baltica SH28 TaxID=993517 RepID=K5DIQ5_RHOBT|nr:hypothetical protein [Rhodopirellula baltica]EKK02308.1 hypothetical protein RBSH_02344 [Rhodopirellula baltica SH28]